MVFTDNVFIPFLFITYICFCISCRSLKFQLLTLLVASYIFYGWWDARFLTLIIFSSLLDYNIGKLIFRTNNEKKRKTYLIISLVGNLGILGFFKYSNFFISNFCQLSGILGFSVDIKLLNIILPVGISFYTFQTLSYSIDIYSRKMEPTDSLLKFMVFVAAFPQLVAGPIVRAKHFLSQVNDNLYDKSSSEGLFYIIYGFIKKVFIADYIGYYIVDPVYLNFTSDIGPLELIIVSYFYAFQIFFDFSAYSDIAIGLGKLFGLELPINFKYPYTSKNPSEFWRKWHISLSTWFRDYLYFPLGGNRGTKTLRLRNVIIVMLLVGLWHGANWTFIAWGALHGLYLSIYPIIEKSKIYINIPNFIKIFIFFNLTCLAWIFFRSPDIRFAITYIKSVFRFSTFWGPFSFHVKIVCCMAAVSVIFHYLIEPRIKKLSVSYSKLHWVYCSLIIYSFFILFSYIGEKGIAHQAFIYFQF
ncbi:MBOAT family O-acyltransferase [uncultured Desulfobacter sp.]|uniref:MBOAT family O-acyltransferase n=1 Tax=uncultured Desulfobacter sp. TaxID=240139 RepID=UPI002AA957D7|nr:MBOAT family O-acyltransferase [uncultured Desulfobacter sp.]